MADRPSIPLVPPAIAGLEPLKEKDANLGVLENCLAENPCDIEMMRYLAEEYDRRGYSRRAEAVLSTIERLKGANGAILLALAKKKLGSEQPLEAIELLLNVLDDCDTASSNYRWAREKIREMARKGVSSTGEKVLPAEAPSPPTSVEDLPPLLSEPKLEPKPEKAVTVLDTALVDSSSEKKEVGRATEKETTVDLGATIEIPAKEKRRIFTSMSSKSRRKERPRGPKKKVIKPAEETEKPPAQNVVSSEPVNTVAAACQALSKDPQNPILLENLGTLLFTNSRFDECIPVFERFVDVQEPSAKTLFCLGTAYEVVGKSAEANVCWDYLRERYPNSPLLEEADGIKDSLSEVETQKTEEVVEPVVAEEEQAPPVPASPPVDLAASSSLPMLQPVVVAELLAQSPELQGQVEQKVSAAAPVDPMANFLQRADEMDVAPVASESVQILHEPPPAKSEAELLKTFSTYEKKDDSDLERIESMLTGSPGNVAVLDWAAYEYFSRGSLDRALDLYTQLLTVSEPSEQAYYCLGCIHASKERVNKAKEYWNLLIDRFSDHRLAAKARAKLQMLEAGI